MQFNVSRILTIPLVFCLTIACVDSVKPPSDTSERSRYFKDCDLCPQMTLVPGGSFLLGSPDEEAGHGDDEGPQTQVSVAPFAVSRFEVTLGQFRDFVRSTDYLDESGCLVMAENGRWQSDANASWASPGFSQEENHPVVCVSWKAARAYVDWLNTQTSTRTYRLMTESEWEYAARAGTTTPYWWGDNENAFCTYTNGVDSTAKAQYPYWERAGTCSDGFVYTAPVGQYAKPNKFGLEDMVGNVWEWVQDCYTSTYEGHPPKGQAIASENCEKRVLRGGAWGDYGSFYLRSAYRGAWSGDEAFSNLGFRVARVN